MKYFAVARPYEDGFRKQVFEFLNGLGFELGSDMVMATGTPNLAVVRWLEELSPKPGLLLIPFHQHADVDGNNLDGLGIVENLPEFYLSRKTPILMPVSDFAFAGSFARRLLEARDKNSIGANLVIPMPPAKIGDDEIRRQIENHRG